MTKANTPIAIPNPVANLPRTDEERLLLKLYRELPKESKESLLKETLQTSGGAPGEHELILSEEEVALVMKHRAAAAAIDEAHLFRINVIKQAAAWLEYSGRTGESLTFSAFVNGFGYVASDCKPVYRHLHKVLKAAYPSGSLK